MDRLRFRGIAAASFFNNEQYRHSGMGKATAGVGEGRIVGVVRLGRCGVGRWALAAVAGSWWRGRLVLVGCGRWWAVVCLASGAGGGFLAGGEAWGVCSAEARGGDGGGCRLG
jgi:hypothetical protein